MAFGTKAGSIACCLFHVTCHVEKKIICRHVCHETLSCLPHYLSCRKKKQFVSGRGTFDIIAAVSVLLSHIICCSSPSREFSAFLLHMPPTKLRVSFVMSVAVVLIFFSLIMISWFAKLPVVLRLHMWSNSLNNLHEIRTVLWMGNSWNICSMSLFHEWNSPMVRLSLLS